MILKPQNISVFFFLKCNSLVSASVHFSLLLPLHCVSSCTHQSQAGSVRKCDFSILKFPRSRALLVSTLTPSPQVPKATMHRHLLLLSPLCPVAEEGVTGVVGMASHATPDLGRCDPHLFFAHIYSQGGGTRHARPQELHSEQSEPAGPTRGCGAPLSPQC